MDTSMDVDLDGCWHHHGASESDEFDSDDLLIESIHSQRPK